MVERKTRVHKNEKEGCLGAQGGKKQAGRVADTPLRGLNLKRVSKKEDGTSSTKARSERNYRKEERKKKRVKKNNASTLPRP